MWAKASYTFLLAEMSGQKTILIEARTHILIIVLKAKDKPEKVILVL
jgi:hypothetical protein